MLEQIKRWLGIAELSEHEKDALRREYRRLEDKRRSKRSTLKSRPTRGGKKKEDPVAKRLTHEISSIERRQKDIERQLGEDLAKDQPESRRRSRR